MIVVIGVDPGATTGIALLDTTEPTNPVLIQTSPDAVITIVNALVDRTQGQHGTVAGVAIERFVRGPRSGKLGTPKGAAIAQDIITQLSHLVGAWGVPTYLRSAAEVKPWATDARIRKLTEHRGMPHALDALRHAMFCAVRDFGMPDPLSRGALGRSRSAGAASSLEIADMLTEPSGDAPPLTAEGT